MSLRVNVENLEEALKFLCDRGDRWEAELTSHPEGFTSLVLRLASHQHVYGLGDDTSKAVRIVASKIHTLSDGLKELGF